MKKLFTLLLIILCVQTLIAGPWNRAMLRIREERGRAIAILVDGVRLNTISNNLTVNDITPGMHNIRIFRYNTNGYGYSNGVLAYEGDINVKPGFIYYLTVFNQALDIEENCCLDNYGHWNHNESWFDPNAEENWNNNHRWDNGENQYRRRRPIENPSWGNFRGVMAISAYNQLLTELRRTPFENSKLTLATTAIADYRLTTQQVAGIIREFSFESTKLQFAKDNFMRVSDPRNYIQLRELFTFHSSKDDFMRFIQGSMNRPR